MPAQIAHRVDFQPVGRPRQTAELAKAATSTGPILCSNSQRPARTRGLAPEVRHHWVGGVVAHLVAPVGWVVAVEDRFMAVYLGVRSCRAGPRSGSSALSTMTSPASSRTLSRW